MRLVKQSSAFPYSCSKCLPNHVVPTNPSFFSQKSAAKQESPAWMYQSGNMHNYAPNQFPSFFFSTICQWSENAELYCLLVSPWIFVLSAGHYKCCPAGCFITMQFDIRFQRMRQLTWSRTKITQRPFSLTTANTTRSKYVFDWLLIWLDAIATTGTSAFDPAIISQVSCGNLFINACWQDAVYQDCSMNMSHNFVPFSLTTDNTTWPKICFQLAPDLARRDCYYRYQCFRPHNHWSSFLPESLYKCLLAGCYLPGLFYEYFAYFCSFEREISS